MNFRGWIDKLENANLRRALHLRMERKFPEALDALNLACKEGDGKAWFFKARAYKYGGWTLLADAKLHVKCIEEARKVFCPWTYINGCGDAYGRGLFYRRTRQQKLAEIKFVEAHALGHPLATLELHYIDNDSKILTEVVAFGDEVTQYNYFTLVHEKDLSLKLAETGFTSAMYDVGDMLYKSLEYIKFVEYTTKNKILFRFEYYARHRNQSSRDVKELFLYGRYFELDRNTDFCSQNSAYDRAKRIYKESSERAKAAVFCFAGLRLLAKDTRRLVGELVWNSRFFPNVWGVTL